uniref:Uncharacterized protein n=1 Tax=Salix viminalis TaxID=40686 RepID=A0A6N2MJW0_SALVM
MTIEVAVASSSPTLLSIPSHSSTSWRFAIPRLFNFRKAAFKGGQSSQRRQNLQVSTFMEFKFL